MKNRKRLLYKEECANDSTSIKERRFYVIESLSEWSISGNSIMVNRIWSDWMPLDSVDFYNALQVPYEERIAYIKGKTPTAEGFLDWLVEVFEMKLIKQ